MPCARRPAILPMSVLTFPVMAAAAADTAVADPDSGVWLLVIITGLIAVLVTVLILIYSLRLVRVFQESIFLFINALSAQTRGPVVTISGEIPAGIRGQIDVVVTGSPALPLEQVTVIISPPPGLVLDEDHIILPGLDTGGTQMARIGHGPALEGKYDVRITVLYRAGDTEKVREFTQAVRAVIQAEAVTTG
ncbi:MAG TPA: hypothetical protein VLL74_00985 [Methanoregula sp.]|nr:hypothetical protein [Methanoregula sp.]